MAEHCDAVSFVPTLSDKYLLKLLVTAWRGVESHTPEKTLH